MTNRPAPRRVGLLPAREIREASAAGASDAALATRYETAASAINRIVRGIAQPHAGGPIRTEPRRAERGPRVHRSIVLPGDLADRIDRVRGSASTTRWLVQAAEERLARAFHPDRDHLTRRQTMNTIDSDPPETCPNDSAPLVVERYTSGWRAHCERCHYRSEAFFAHHPEASPTT